MKNKKRTYLQSRIKTLREKRGVSTSDLRDIFHMDPHLKGRIEDGDMNVTVRSLIKYLDALGLELDVRQKAITVSEYELELIKKATGVDILEMISKGQKPVNLC